VSPLMLLTAGFLVTLVLGAPIFVSIGIGSLLCLLASDVPLKFFAQVMYTGIDQFPIMAIPCFVLAGYFMERGGVSKQIIDAISALVGSLPGGLGVVTVLACMFFAAISGSGPATVAAIGTIMIPAMVREGYSPDYAAAVSATGGTLGILIPPSNPMIVYGVVGNVSIAALFMAGFLPGIIVGMTLIVTCYFIARRSGFSGRSEKIPFRQFLLVLRRSIWALLTPVIILGGIYGGIFTAVESSVIAVVYGLFVGVVINRKLTLNAIFECLGKSSVVLGALILIMGVSMAFGRVVSMYDIPQKVTAFIVSISDNWVVAFMLVNAFLIFVGMWMETLSAIIILTPILLPAMTHFGIDPIHFGILIVITSEIGFLTPPLGVNLFVATSLAGISFERVIRATLLYIAVLMFDVVVFTLFPKLSLVVPQLLMGK
jgi:C4-dicarboxylate transporter, DctM subunit